MTTDLRNGELMGITRGPAPQTEAQRELAELRARRAEVEDLRAAKESPTESQQIETERRAIADAEAVIAAIDKHGQVGRMIEVVDTALGKVIVTRASAARYKKFQDMGDFTHEATERLVRPNVIHPDIAVFDRMCDEQPMIVIFCGNAMSRLAGVRKQDIEKK